MAYIQQAYRDHLSNARMYHHLTAQESEDIEKGTRADIK